MGHSVGYASVISGSRRDCSALVGEPRDEIYEIRRRRWDKAEQRDGDEDEDDPAENSGETAPPQNAPFLLIHRLSRPCSMWITRGAPLYFRTRQW